MKIEEISVEYVDHMGSDVNVVNAARVSFAKQVEEFDLEKDTKLINYLAKHKHWSPLAHTSITLRIKAPIFLARQYVKHQVGGVWNEVSRRYVDDEPSFWFPKVWHQRPKNAKQGSSDDPVTKYVWHEYNDNAPFEYQYGVDTPVDVAAEDFCEHALKLYNAMLFADVAPEEARIILPLNTMTEWMWTGSAVFFDRVVGQRVDSHAQKAANELGFKINDIVSPIYPVTWQALSKARE